MREAIQRQRKGETLEEIAKEMGFTKQGLSKRIKAEMGRRAVSKNSKALRIASHVMRAAHEALEGEQ